MIFLWSFLPTFTVYFSCKRILEEMFEDEEEARAQKRAGLTQVWDPWVGRGQEYCRFKHVCTNFILNS